MPSNYQKKPSNVNAGTYVAVQHNDKDPKLKFGDHVKNLKHKSIVAKDYTPNWSEKVFVIKRVKILYPKHMLLLI